MTDFFSVRRFTIQQTFCDVHSECNFLRDISSELGWLHEKSHSASVCFEENEATTGGGWKILHVENKQRKDIIRDLFHFFTY